MASDLTILGQLPALTRQIVETYTTLASINHLGHCPLPSYDEVIAATEDLKEILYPGYRRRSRLHVDNVTYHVGDLIDRLHERLSLQIRQGVVPRGGQEQTVRSQAARRLRARSASRRPMRSSSGCPESARCSAWTSRPPTTATRPASRSTR